MVNRFRRGAVDSRVINFKLHNHGADDYRIVLDILKEHFKAVAVVGIASSGTEENNIQKICGREIYFTVLKARPKKHNAKQGIRLKDEAERVKLVRSGPTPKRIILVDDICTTGATMVVYSMILNAAGIKDIVLFSLGHTRGEKELVLKIYIKEREDSEKKGLAGITLDLKGLNG